jgi:hypothetical protein
MYEWESIAPSILFLYGEVTMDLRRSPYSKTKISLQELFSLGPFPYIPVLTGSRRLTWDLYWGCRSPNS